MTSNQYYVKEVEKNKEVTSRVEAHHRMPDGKLIALMQTCLQCGRMISFKRNRRHCPYCQGLLRTKTIILDNLKRT